MSTKKHKLDIFRVLSKISTKDRGFYRSLSEEEQKALVPFVVMRWLTGTRDKRQVLFLNELVNPFAFAFDKNHRELLVYLLTIASSGKQQKYYWNKANAKRNESSSVVKVVSEYYNYSQAKARDVVSLLTNEEILSYAEELGKQPDELKKLKADLKKRG